MDNNNQIVVYQTADNQTQIEVHMENETVWLTQAQMAELFQKDRTVISRHIRNVFNEGELEEQSTCAKFAHMGHDGLQQYETVMYNLDVIISVGYRVKSQRGTAFRIWATKVLKASSALTRRSITLVPASKTSARSGSPSTAWR